jgi:ribosome maturation factor RimP
MINEHQIEAIGKMINELLQDNPDYFLVDITIKPVNSIQVLLDSDSGLSIEKCVRYNRALYKKIEEAALYTEGDFALEVSSPGLDEPLKSHRQYLKNIGRQVEITTNEGVIKEGKLLSVTEKDLIVEEITGKNHLGKPNGKKREVLQHTLSFDNIKSTKIQIVF